MWTFRIASLSFITLLLASKWGNLPHPDTNALQGTWEIVSVERQGTPDPAPVGFTLKFVRDEVHFQMPLEGSTPTPSVAIKPVSNEKLQHMYRG